MAEDGITPREDTYNTLMNCALSSDNADKVPQLFDQLAELSLQPNSLSYNALITAFARMQNSSAAVRYIPLDQFSAESSTFCRNPLSTSGAPLQCLGASPLVFCALSLWDLTEGSRIVCAIVQMLTLQS